MLWGLREWLLAGGDGRKPARMKGLQIRGHIAVIQVCSVTVRERGRTANLHMHSYTGPGGGQHAPV